MEENNCDGFRCSNGDGTVWRLVSQSPSFWIHMFSMRFLFSLSTPNEKPSYVPAADRTVDTTTKRQFDLSVTSKQFPEPSGPIETTLESCLRRERENTLMSLVEETIQQVRIAWS